MKSLFLSLVFIATILNLKASEPCNQSPAGCPVRTLAEWKAFIKNSTCSESFVQETIEALNTANNLNGDQKKWINEALRKKFITLELKNIETLGELYNACGALCEKCFMKRHIKEVMKYVDKVRYKLKKRIADDLMRTELTFDQACIKFKIEKQYFSEDEGFDRAKEILTDLFNEKTSGLKKEQKWLEDLRALNRWRQSIGERYIISSEQYLDMSKEEFLRKLNESQQLSNELYLSFVTEWLRLMNQDRAQQLYDVYWLERVGLLHYRAIQRVMDQEYNIGDYQSSADEEAYQFFLDRLKKTEDEAKKRLKKGSKI